MANTKKNALEELAKRLDIIVFGLVTDGHPCDETIDIRKAQRIIEELANVEVCKGAEKFMPLDKPYDDVTVYAESESDYGGNGFSHADSDCILDLANAAWNARIIAEEGVDNGK